MIFGIALAATRPPLGVFARFGSGRFVSALVLGLELGASCFCFLPYRPSFLGGAASARDTGSFFCFAARDGRLTAGAVLSSSGESER